MTNIEEKFYKCQKEAEIAIDNLVTEVFYMGEFCASKEEVQKVIKILRELSDYIENEDYLLTTELNYINEGEQDE